MEDVLGTCLERGVRVVANAGGLNPAGLAAKITELSGRLGLNARVAHITGDDLAPVIGDLQAAGHELANLDTGLPLAKADLPVVTANAYLGGWGITAALQAGADVVICPRVTDASLVTGPAAWWHGWRRDEWDALAGAVAAGHVIECGPQACGGNYSFLGEITDRRYPGFPIAEVAADGSSVITKHDGTGGRVSTGTVTAQLLCSAATTAHLRVTVKDTDERKVGRAFSNAATELALAGYVGYHTTTPPTPATAFGLYWPALIPGDLVPQAVHLPGGETQVVRHHEHAGQPPAMPQPPATPQAAGSGPGVAGPTENVPLGRLCGARSGDKGGDANVGLWALSPRAYAWLRGYLTTDRLAVLLAEAAGLPIERYELPLAAVGFHGSSLRPIP
jgi:hypothetical protein